MWVGCRMGAPHHLVQAGKYPLAWSILRWSNVPFHIQMRSLELAHNAVIMVKPYPSNRHVEQTLHHFNGSHEPCVIRVPSGTLRGSSFAACYSDSAGCLQYPEQASVCHTILAFVKGCYL